VAAVARLWRQLKPPGQRLSDIKHTELESLGSASSLSRFLQIQSPLLYIARDTAVGTLTQPCEISSTFIGDFWPPPSKLGNETLGRNAVPFAPHGICSYADYLVLDGKALPDSVHALAEKLDQ
jgi:hypothetical protein